MRILVQVFSFLIFLSLTTNIHALEHVSLIKKSVQQWNQWRENNPEVIPDLEGINLANANLNNANLAYANLNNANLRGAYFIGSNLKGADLFLANLEGTTLIMSNLQNANLSMAYLKEADLRVANLKGANFTDADLAAARLYKVHDLTCDQINSVKSLNKDTKFPNYLEVKITGRKKWKCKEVKRK